MPVKQSLRKLFAPILESFESGDEPYIYKPSHRNVLIIIGCLFTGLAIAVLWLAMGQDPGYFIPVVVFAAIGLISLIVGILGNDRAIARIWRSARK